MKLSLKLDEPQEINLEIWRDTDIRWTIYVQNPDKTPIDITGWTIEGMFSTEYGDNSIAQWTTTIVDADAGQFALTLTRSQTADNVLLPDKIVWTLFTTDAAGKREVRAFGTVRMREVTRTS